MKAFDCDTLFGPWPADERDTSLEALLSGMQRLGITKALTASTIGLFWHQDVGNETTLKVCSRHRQLIPMATLNPRCISDASREVQRLAQEAYFFRTSAYSNQLLREIEANPDLILPESRRNEGR